MSLTIPATDHGQIRVFAVTGPVPPGLVDKDADALTDTFGVTGLDADFIDVFDTQALGDMTLTDFLQHGYDITPDAADLAMLQGLEGIVVLMMSRAAGGETTVLSLGAGVKHVTTLGDKAQLSVAPPLESLSSQGVIEPIAGKPAKSDARIGGMVAMVALVVMMLLVGLMVWVGG
ncbi:hypothetical protein AB3Y40_00130 [Yoonia sp. R2331]|uniref:hypothetical protein n=1 Tax=Yoonia sp. R2331 TaxID=3237238 RepID=UPI0034E3AFB7